MQGVRSIVDELVLGGRATAPPAGGTPPCRRAGPADGDGVHMGTRQAEALVRAYLDRRPQDELEAAVVLESWGGVRSPQALATARTMAFSPGVPPPSARRRRRSTDVGDDDHGRAAEAIGSLALVAAVLVLAATAGGSGAELVAEAWRPALPPTFAAAWFLRRRLGAGPASVGLLRHEPPILLVLVAGLLALLAVVTAGGALVAAFSVLGGAGAVTVQRGWGVVAAAAVVVVAFAAAGLDAGAPLATCAAAGAALVVAAAAVATAPATRRRRRPAVRALGAGASGAAVGVVVVLVTRTTGGATAVVIGLALVPSLAASLVAGARLAQFWRRVPGALAVTPVRRPAGRARQVAVAVLAEAAGLLVAVLLVLSAWAAWLAGLLGLQAAVVPLLVGFAGAAVVAQVVSVLEAFARPVWAVGAGTAGSGAYLGLTEVVAAPSAWGLVAAVLCSLAVGGPPLAALVRRPAHALATLV